MWEDGGGGLVRVESHLEGGVTLQLRHNQAGGMGAVKKESLLAYIRLHVGSDETSPSLYSWLDSAVIGYDRGRL